MAMPSMALWAHGRGIRSTVSRSTARRCIRLPATYGNRLRLCMSHRAGSHSNLGSTCLSMESG